MSRLVFTGFDYRTPHKPVVSKTSEADTWLRSYDHLADVGGKRGGCKQISQGKGACSLLNKKEAKVDSKTSAADIWLRSYDHLTDVGGQRGGCQQLSQWKGACFLLNKKEAKVELIQVNDDGERKGGAGWVYGATTSFRNLEVSNSGSKMIGSNKCDVCKAPGPHSSISEEFLYSPILRPKKPFYPVNPLLSINQGELNRRRGQ